MLELKVVVKVTRPEYRVYEHIVQLNGVEKLTPKSARSALRVAGVGCPATVFDLNSETAYHVYAKSSRKFDPLALRADSGNYQP
jgi:hypothetical protein